MSAFGMNSQIPAEDLGGGVSRKILKYGGGLMMVEVTMKKGGMGAVVFGPPPPSNKHHNKLPPRWGSGGLRKAPGALWLLSGSRK